MLKPKAVDIKSISRLFTPVSNGGVFHVCLAAFQQSGQLRLEFESTDSIAVLFAVDRLLNSRRCSGKSFVKLFKKSNLISFNRPGHNEIFVSIFETRKFVF